MKIKFIKMRWSDPRVWGAILLLAATFIIASQWLAPFTFGTFAATALAIVFLVRCIKHKTITTLPFATALIYIVLRNFNVVPHVSSAALLLAAWLAYMGLRYLLPKKKSYRGVEW